jgi:golgi-specific brefeldin A-resistance guanine nucleotide exchange factor 1
LVCQRSFPFSHRSPIQPSLRDQIYVSFDILSGLPPAVAASVAEQVISGVNLVVQKHREIIRYVISCTYRLLVANRIPISSQTEWNLVFALIRSTISHPEAARMSFELITHLASEGPDQFVTVDNFGGLITLLDDFATSASLSVEMQQGQAWETKSLDSSKYVIQTGQIPATLTTIQLTSNRTRPQIH